MGATKSYADSILKKNTRTEEPKKSEVPIDVESVDSHEKTTPSKPTDNQKNDKEKPDPIKLWKERQIIFLISHNLISNSVF